MFYSHYRHQFLEIIFTFSICEDVMRKDTVPINCEYPYPRIVAFIVFNQDSLGYRINILCRTASGTLIRQ